MPGPSPLSPPDRAGGEIFLFLPGLNLRPEKLHPLKDHLCALGHAAAEVGLSGLAEEDPRQRAAAWGCVSAEGWLADVDRAWALLAERHPGAAPSLVGYSLGALLGMVWSLERGIPLRRAILIAPAFRLKWYAPPLLSALGILLPGALRLPSRGAKAYIRHRGTTLAAYGALVALVRQFRRQLARLPAPRAAGLPPQLVVYSPADELIATGYLERYRAHAPERIALHRLGHRPPRGIPHHLAIDAHTLGDSEWAALLAALTDWLGPAQPPGRRQGAGRDPGAKPLAPPAP